MGDPWVEKYRPQGLDDIISQKSVIETLKKFIERDGEIPHLLFYGPPGTGKTTTIFACARLLVGGNPKKHEVKELNASDSRGIDVVRTEIKSFASSSLGPKLIILDEADQMTSAAQAALRRVVEKYTRNARFCLICNYSNKIIPALQSRCTRFRFGPLDEDSVRERLKYICHSEKVDFEEDGLQALIRLGVGDMRRSINLLQSTVMSSSVVNMENVFACAGQPLPDEIKKIVSWLLNDRVHEVLARIDALRTVKGLAMRDIVTEVHELVLGLDIPPKSRVYLLHQLSELEYRLSKETNESLQLGSLVAMFQIVRGQILKEREKESLRS